MEKDKIRGSGIFIIISILQKKFALDEFFYY